MIKIGRYPSIKIQDQEFSLFIKFVRFDTSLVDKVKSLPKRYYVPEEKVWEIPLTDVDRLVTLFGTDNIEVVNTIPEYQKYIDYMKQQHLPKRSIEETKEYYRTLQSEVPYIFKTRPDGHQIETFNKALHEDILLITDVMGLGKTKQAIDVMDYKKTQGTVKRVLVVCGINGTKYNWMEEIQKHSHNNCQVIDGTKKQKLEKLHQSWMFFYNIINVESLRSKIGSDEVEYDNEMIAFIEEAFNSGLYDAVIVDEIHKCANHKSQQGKNLNRLKCKHKIGLTGTPMTKSVHKVWNILHWFGIVQESYWNFVKQYCILGGMTGWTPIGVKNLDELHNRLDRYQVRRTKDILDLPPKVYKTVYIEMSAKDKKEYRLIKDGIIKDLELNEVKFINPAVATIKLRQFTDTLKIHAVVELIKELKENDEACVVFSYYKDVLYAINAECEANDLNPLMVTGDVKEAKDKMDLVNQFQNNPKHSVMIGTIQALGTGFTLTRSNNVIFVNKSYVVGENEQATDRCHRRGTTDTVTVVSVIVKGTVDERVEQILALDKKHIDHVVDGIVEPQIQAKDLISILMED